MACPECGARSGHLLGCTRSTVSLAPAMEPVPTLEEASLEPSVFERWRLVAFPATFLLMWLLSGTGLGALLRLFFGMWLHELGHAAAAWLSGHWAIPLPWVTYTFDRSWLVTGVVFGGLVALAVLGWRRRVAPMVAVSVALLVLAVVAHAVPSSSQKALFSFAGDAGAMVLGALLASMYLVRSPHPFFREGLRLGWLVIGSASWADATRVWWESKKDPANLPLGIESFGFGASSMPSDASRLVDEFGWDERTLVTRFLLVAGLSLLGCAVAFCGAVLRERRLTQASNRA